MAIVGDNASNVKLAAQSLNIKFYSCFAHVLNLVVTGAIKKLKIEHLTDDQKMNDLKDFPQVVQKCRKLVGLFSHSSQLTEQLLADQRHENMSQQKTKKKKRVLRLIQDVITR